MTLLRTHHPVLIYYGESSVWLSVEIRADLYSLLPQRGDRRPKNKGIGLDKVSQKKIFALLIVIEIILGLIGKLFGTRFLAEMCL